MRTEGNGFCRVKKHKISKKIQGFIDEFPKKNRKISQNNLKKSSFPPENRKYAQARTEAARLLFEGKILNFLPVSEINTHNKKVVL